ncbi:MAG: dienelactone hydrolase family protein [Candidatus Omnitrophica bacterium]|nr:dienelactone hydrolase family protein [Candidatus Omnitrophota bacterium]
MRKMLIAAAVFLLSAGFAQAAVQGKEVDYSAEGVTLKGYLAYDDAVEGKRPGVLVVHEWWGHNEYARKRARMLAELGYTALAVDMYGDGKQANHPDDAGKFAGEVAQNMPVAKARFLAALNLLKSDPTVDADKIAAIGYCFGGGVVLNMARMGVDLKGVVSFHGSLGAENPAQPGVVKPKVLVCHGAADSFTTPQQIEDFKKEMESAGIDYKFIIYPDAKHSFTNPDADRYAKEFGLPVGYNAHADQKSWADMQEFFKKIF